MAHLTDPERWYLFDYGMVISTEPTAEDWDALEEAAGTPVRRHNSSYWEHRTEFDAGILTSADYWSLVTGRTIAHGHTGLLDTLDANQWSHFNLDTLDVLESLSSTRGCELALLSNMPAAMVAEFSQAAWTGYFSRMFFSSTLHMIKPERAIFEHVLSELGAPPDQVTFIDDAPANVEAARELGMNALLHTPGIDLQRELQLIS